MNENETTCSAVLSYDVVVSRAEYDDLVRARMGIDCIAASHGKYGYDSDVIRAVMKQFGYDHAEGSDA